MELHPCGRCRRHVRDATCPFCGAAQSALLTRLVHAGGRLSRAAVFAGAAACYTNATPSQQQTPPPPPPPDGEQFAQPPPGDGEQRADHAVPAAGSVEGVIDEGGAPVAGATVQLRDASGHETQARTDQHGQYVFKGLAPGRYTLTARVNQNPRQAQPTQSVVVEEGKVAHADFQATPYVPDRGPCCKPYGAPPARRRVV